MARKNDYGTRNYDYGDLVCCVKEWSQIDRRVALKFGNNFQVILFLFLNRDHRSFFIFVASRAAESSVAVCWWLVAAGGQAVQCQFCQTSDLQSRNHLWFVVWAE